jgi:hypothetical protein
VAQAVVVAHRVVEQLREALEILHQQAQVKEIMAAQGRELLLIVALVAAAVLVLLVVMA